MSGTDDGPGETATDDGPGEVPTSDGPGETPTAEPPEEAVTSAEEAAERTEIRTEEISGLGELLPEPLRPLWRPVEAIQGFRRAHGERYIKVLEALLAAILIGGYVWWAYLFFTG